MPECEHALQIVKCGGWGAGGNRIHNSMYTTTFIAEHYKLRLFMGITQGNINENKNKFRPFEFDLLVDHQRNKLMRSFQTFSTSMLRV